MNEWLNDFFYKKNINKYRGIATHSVKVDLVILHVHNPLFYNWSKASHNISVTKTIV